ncbi:MAG: hypothetical protein IPJ71_10140 [Bdellovibrionales bacterium]|nr:hypothetical protein [Bdellovibrionales bacterium]
MLYSSRQVHIQHPPDTVSEIQAQITELKTGFSKDKILQFREKIKSGAIRGRELQAAATEISERVNSKSLTLEANLKRPTPFGFKPDVIVIGDGPHAAISAVNIRLANPSLKVLVVTASDEIGGVFAATGGFYRLNAPELIERSAHPFPNAPFQLLDVAEPGYIMARDLGNIIALNLYSSSEILLHQVVKGVTFDGAKYSVALDNGISIETQAVILASGLGNLANYGVVDQESMELLLRLEQESENAMNPLNAPLVEHYGELAVRASQITILGRERSFLSAYEGKRVAVIGAGGAGGTVVEALSGYGPGKIYGQPEDGQLGQKLGPGIKENGGVLSIDWWGQKSDTHFDFNAKTNNRFAPTIGTYREFQKYNRLLGRAHKVHVVIEEGTEKIQLTAADGRSRIYDKVIFATAYDHSPITWTSHGSSVDKNSKPIMGRLPDGRYVKIGTTLEGSDNPRSIIVGPSAGQIVPDEEFMNSPTLTWTSIDVLAERTAAAARWLVRNIEMQPGER